MDTFVCLLLLASFVCEIEKQMKRGDVAGTGSKQADGHVPFLFFGNLEFARPFVATPACNYSISIASSILGRRDLSTPRVETPEAIPNSRL